MSVGPSNPGTSGTPATSPADDALRLEALLGEHSVLALDMMRARVRGDADLAQAADDALGRNTSALRGVLEPVVGAQGQAVFASAWDRHIQDLFGYAQALSTRNPALRDRTQGQLVRDEDDLAAFVVSRSSGRLTTQAALDAVRLHVDHLLAGADAYAAGNYAGAAQLYRTSFAHSFDLGAALATGLFPPEALSSLQTPSRQLQAALTRLLGEHVALAVAQMRASLGDRADFAAVGSALNGNTLDLTGAVDSLFGSAAARQFQGLWADHVDALMAYTRAAAGGDPAGQEQARGRLRAFESSFTAFLDTATQGRLGQPALAQAMTMHDRMLLAVIDAYRAKDYAHSHELADQTYQDVAALSGRLASAIGDTIAARLPHRGPQTGGGGMAAVVGSR
ncbi:MAG TPA: hypothetical protein VFP72_01465 [Kineosporiaceae bacterium]|nr:hypothetical protein [Kineosporiaceae bacterium]